MKIEKETQKQNSIFCIFNLKLPKAVKKLKEQ